MGTSASSSGPGSGVPLVPPWVSDAEFNNGTSPSVDSDNAPEDDFLPNNGDGNQPSQVQPQLAPPARFRSARRNLGEFSRSGNSKSLKKGLGHYTRSGLGGSRQATARMARTAQNSGALYAALNALSGRGTVPPDLIIDLQDLRGRSAQEITDTLAETISPSNGSQDAEANRESISQAFRELIQENSDIDLTALTEEQVISVIESYIVYDICKRIELDVGKAIFDKTDPVTAINRLKEMQNYVKQCVASSFKKVWPGASRLSQREASRIARKVIQSTFDVFEEYIQ